MRNEDERKTFDFDSETKQSMEKSNNKPLEKDDKENELRSRLPIRRNQERHTHKKKQKTTQVPKNNQKKPKSNQGHMTSQVQEGVCKLDPPIKKVTQYQPVSS